MLFIVCNTILRGHRKAIRANKTHKTISKWHRCAIELQIFFLSLDFHFSNIFRKNPKKKYRFLPSNCFHIIKFSFITSTKLNHNAIWTILGGLPVMPLCAVFSSSHCVPRNIPLDFQAGEWEWETLNIRFKKERTVHTA